MDFDDGKMQEHDIIRLKTRLDEFYRGLCISIDEKQFIEVILKLYGLILVAEMLQYIRELEDKLGIEHKKIG